LSAGPAEAVAVPAGEAAAAEAAAADPATCDASTCEEPPAADKRKACKMHINPPKKTVCEFGFDTGFMVMCGIVCDDPTMDKEIFKSEDVVGSTCEPGADKRACSDGFRGGVDAAAAVANPAAVAPPENAYTRIQNDMKKRREKDENKRAAAAARNENAKSTKQRELDAKKLQMKTSQEAEVQRQRVQTEKRGKEQSKAANAEDVYEEDAIILGGKEQEAAVKAAERKRLQDEEEAARIQWLKDEEEAEERREKEREQLEKAIMAEARFNATEMLKNRTSRSKEQVRRDKKIADDLSKEIKKKKKRGRADF
jgi:hypothetical protein